jgi:hypothetical protein
MALFVVSGQVDGIYDRDMFEGKGADWFLGSALGSGTLSFPRDHSVGSCGEHNHR